MHTADSHPGGPDRPSYSAAASLAAVTRRAVSVRRVAGRSASEGHRGHRHRVPLPVLPRRRRAASSRKRTPGAVWSRPRRRRRCRAAAGEGDRDRAASGRRG
eukprot:28626-Pelagococcus_subviridis.AAC.8